jgi:hypothetical protein
MDGEAGTSSHGTLDFDPTPVFLHHTVGHGESEAGAFSHVFGGEEGLEDMFARIGRDSSPLVSDPQNHEFSRGHLSVHAK